MPVVPTFVVLRINEALGFYLSSPPMNFPHVLSTLMRATRTRTALTFRTNTMYIPLGGAHNGEKVSGEKARNGEASIPSASKNSASPWPCSQESHDPGGSLTHTRRERLTGVRMPWDGRCIDLGISNLGLVGQVVLHAIKHVLLLPA